MPKFPIYIKELSRQDVAKSDTKVDRLFRGNSPTSCDSWTSNGDCPHHFPSDIPCWALTDPTSTHFFHRITKREFMRIMKQWGLENQV